MRVYLAGPLFTPYERRFLDEVAAALRTAGIDVFVPHEQPLPPEGRTPGAIYAADRAGIAAADALVAVLDGPSVDDGTAVEIGLFTGLMAADPAKRGVLGLTTDMRLVDGLGRQPLNLFVAGCIEASGRICTSVEEILAELDRWR
jgi:nucleoside 2-deoxyribosyltransferase